MVLAITTFEWHNYTLGKSISVDNVWYIVFCSLKSLHSEGIKPEKWVTYWKVVYFQMHEILLIVIPGIQTRDVACLEVTCLGMGAWNFKTRHFWQKIFLKGFQIYQNYLCALIGYVLKSFDQSYFNCPTKPPFKFIFLISHHSHACTERHTHVSHEHLSTSGVSNERLFGSLFETMGSHYFSE